jgi:hypothetical protein
VSTSSSGSERERPEGIIRQGSRIVGAICIPDPSEAFIDQFNNCYGPLRMQCSKPDSPSELTSANPHRFRLPAWFRHVWQASSPPAVPAPVASPQSLVPPSP